MWLRDPRVRPGVPAPEATPPPTRTISERRGGKLRYKPHLFVYLYACIYFRRKEPFRGQEAHRPRAASLCPLESELVHDKYESKLKGRNGGYGEGALYAHAGFYGR